ncbi:hypothetical protein [uncultured Maricaulis sp.]|uniref:hypothetical protein n=1 Tax=uncultured Maricaulis sp. TaxID=174710 RepID=UPI0030D6D82C|tara:strand:- start:17572 stop:18684 length:1113 start_codon:yes stop_codon:yes gene_type:complete
MRQWWILLGVALGLMPACDAQETRQALRPELAALEVLANACWSFDRDLYGLEFCFDTQLDGQILRAVQTDWNDTMTFSGADLILYWDAAEHRIAYRQYTSSGDVAEGWIIVTADSLAFRGDGIRLSPDAGSASPYQFRFVSSDALDAAELAPGSGRGLQQPLRFERRPPRLNKDRGACCDGAWQVAEWDSYRRLGVPSYMAAHLSHQLAPMEFMLRIGVADDPGDGLHHVRGGEPMYGGHFLRQLEVVTGSGGDVREETIYYWDAEAGEARFDAYSSVSGSRQGRVVFTEDGVRLAPLSDPSGHDGYPEMELRPGDPESGQVLLVSVRPGQAAGPVDGSQIRFERPDRADIVLLLGPEWAPDAPAFSRPG